MIDQIKHYVSSLTDEAVSEVLTGFFSAAHSDLNDGEIVIVPAEQLFGIMSVRAAHLRQIAVPVIGIDQLLDRLNKTRDNIRIESWSLPGRSKTCIFYFYEGTQEVVGFVYL